MGNHISNFDIIIVGASIAGCTAALLYAQKSIKVLLIDKIKSDESYKKVCTHYVQPCGAPILKKLDLYKDIDLFGVESKSAFYTNIGWLISEKKHYSNGNYSVNMERSRFDPYIRNKANENPFIELQLDTAIESVIYNEKEHTYDVVVNNGEKKERYKTKLLIAADGRYSKVADIVSNEPKVYPNDRFAYFAYYENYKLPGAAHFSYFWTLEEGLAFIYPQLNNRVLIALFIDKKVKEKWRLNIEKSFNEFVGTLPNASDLKKAKRVTSFRGMSDIKSLERASVHTNIPFIGDAALSLDPAAGTGCSFALLSANCLVEQTFTSIKNNEELSKPLKAYAEKYKQLISPHIKGVVADSLIIPNTKAADKFYSTIMNSEVLKEAFIDLTGRLKLPKEFHSLFLKEAYKNKHA